MADVTFTTLANLLIDKYGALVVDALTKYGPGNWVSEQSFLGRLQTRGKVLMGGADGNNSLPREWGVHYSGGTAASFGVNDAFPAAVAESYMQAKLEWKRVGIGMNYDNLVRAGQRGAIRGGLDAVAQDFEAKMKSLISSIEAMLFTDGTGNGSKDVTGALAFLSTANTYATINQGAYSWWRASLVDALGAALTKDHLRTATQALLAKGGMKMSTTEVWVPSNQFSKFQQLYEDNFRYVPGGEISDRGAYRFSDGAVDLPVYFVQGIPSTEIWILDTDELEMRFLDQVPSDELPVREETVSREGMPFALVPVYENRDVSGYFLKAYPQLVCTNPSKMARIHTLAA